MKVDEFGRSVAPMPETAKDLKWYDLPHEASFGGWYWWRAAPGKMAVPVFVDRNRLTNLLSPRSDGVHVACIGGQWSPIPSPPEA